MRHINPHGPLRLYESLSEQLERLGKLRETTPMFAAALMKQGQCLVRLAEAGEFGKIARLVDASEEGELLFWYHVKMFNAACQHGHRDVVRYMVCEGFDFIRYKGVKDALHVVVEHAPAPAAAALVQDLVDIGYPVNYQRHPDFFTPLHAACTLMRDDVVQVLVANGADVNAVAKVC